MALCNVGDPLVGVSIVRRLEFDTRTHSLAGHVGGAAAGRMYTPFRERYEELCRTNQVTYSVVSCSTVIAYHVLNGGWVVPECRYSNTTSRHQGIVRTAIQGRAMYTPDSAPAKPEAAAWPPVTDHLARVHGLAQAAQS